VVKDKEIAEKKRVFSVTDVSSIHFSVSCVLSHTFWLNLVS
jgi:hypothetical protein